MNLDQFQIVGFGFFEVHNRPACLARNPSTGDQIEIAAAKAPVFKAGKALKEYCQSRKAKKTVLRKTGSTVFPLKETKWICGSRNQAILNASVPHADCSNPLCSALPYRYSLLPSAAPAFAPWQSDSQRSFSASAPAGSYIRQTTP